MANPVPQIARTIAETRERHVRWRDLDPFPSISPALLNAADIYDYVSVTGMIHGFNIKRLKQSAYKMALANEVWYWDEKENNEVFKKFPCGAEIVVPKNSIIYVKTKEKFFLPNYIALRFNLDVSLVHKGMLLGTGPLINPGYCGELMIPLHNLVANQHSLTIGETIISVEFTKLSQNSRWDTTYSPDVSKDIFSRPQAYPVSDSLCQPENTTFSHYKDRALGNNKSIMSALADMTSEYRTHTLQLQNTIKEARSTIERFTKYSIIGAFLGLITVAGLVYTIVSMLQDNKSFVNTIKEEVKVDRSILHNKLNELNIENGRPKAQLEQKAY